MIPAYLLRLEGDTAASADGEDTPRGDKEGKSRSDLEVVVLGDSATAVGGTTIVPRHGQGPAGEQEDRGEAVAAGTANNNGNVGADEEDDSEDHGKSDEDQADDAEGKTRGEALLEHTTSEVAVIERRPAYLPVH